MTQDSTQTRRLLDLARRGDPSAVGRVLHAHRAYLRRVIQLRLDDRLRRRIDPSDVVQETQVFATQRIGAYLANPAVPFRVWLRESALQRLADLNRRHLSATKRSVRLEQDSAALSSAMLAEQLLSNPSGGLRRRESARQVRAAIERLREADREILLLRNYEELSPAETAAVLGVNINTAVQRYGRALRRLAVLLRDHGLSEGDLPK